MWHDWQKRILLRGSFALAVAALLPNAAPVMEGPRQSDEILAERDSDLPQPAGEPAHPPEA